MKQSAYRAGFTLIEMLLAVVVVSLLTGLLFTVLFQTNRAVRTVDTIVDGHSKAILVQQLMVRDLAGAYIPVQYVWQQQEEKARQKQIEEQKKKEQKATNALATQTNEKPPAPVPRLTKVFYGDARDTMMHELTFITTNPLPSYWDGKVGKAKPRIARVTYRLQQDEQRAREKPVYTLMREESFDLMYQERNSERKHAYPVVHGIRTMSVTYTAMIPAESNREATRGTTGEQQVRTTPVWNVEQEGGNQELIKHGIIVPQLVKIDLVIQEAAREDTYSFTVAIQALGIQQQQETPIPPPPSQSTAESVPQQSSDNVVVDATILKLNASEKAPPAQQSQQQPVPVTQNKKSQQGVP